MSKNFRIRNQSVGDGHPAFIIAEIGSNHNQDYELALRMIESALKSGADAVKFQTFKAEQHVSKWAETPAFYEERNTPKPSSSVGTQPSMAGGPAGAYRSTGRDILLVSMRF